MVRLRQLLQLVRRRRGGPGPPWRAHSRPETQPPGAQAAPGVPQRPVTVLAIIRDPAGRAALEQIAAACDWTLHLASGRDEAMARLTASGIPLAILDRDLPDTDWRETLPALAALPHAPCVLLASAVADEYLWLEISRHGGLDILPKPFQKEAVARIVTFAWSWRTWNQNARAPARPGQAG